MHVKVSNESGVAKVEVIRPADSEVVDTLEVGDGQTVTLTATVNDGQPGVDVGQVAGTEEAAAGEPVGDTTTTGTEGTATGEAPAEGAESTDEAGSDAGEGSEPPAEGAAA